MTLMMRSRLFRDIHDGKMMVNTSGRLAMKSRVKEAIARDQA